MVSRPIIVLSLLLATGHGAVSAASSSSSPSRQLRASSHVAAVSASTSSEDIPNVVSTRSLQEELDATNISTDKAIDTTIVQIPTDCLNLLAASANQNQKLKKANFFVFTDGMSNGYYSFNNMTEYSDLPMTNKFGFVTLSCQCHAFGGRGNCCQGDRAMLDITGIDKLESMSTQMQEFVKDICTVTLDSIGDNKLPPTGELPTTARPTTSVPPSEAPSIDSLSKSPTRAPIIGSIEPTEAPTEQNIPEVIAPGNGSTDGTKRTGEGLSPGGWAGIALAGACILTIMLYLVPGGKKDEEQDVENRLVNYNTPDLDDMSLAENGKELLTITTNCEMQSDCPPRIESPDATNSMTASDVSSLPSVSSGNHNRSEYYANHSLLRRPDEESVLSSSDEDGPSFFNDGDAGIEEGVEVSNSQNLSAILNSSGASQGSDNLDHAIESGNWEAVAASAAAIVKQSDSSTPNGGSMSV